MARPDQLILADHKDCTELRMAGDAPGRGITVDFSRIERRGMRQTPLGKAIGKATTVIDATAGLCYDAMMLAMLGCGVTAIEQSPLLEELVRDALERAGREGNAKSAGRGSSAKSAITSDAIDRIRLLCGDSRKLIPTLPPAQVILLDPMFPPRRKASALPSKEIRMVAAAAAAFSGDPLGHELFSVALKHATHKVLVKRADDSPPLVESPKPTATYRGRTSRIDAYTVK